MLKNMARVPKGIMLLKAALVANNDQRVYKARLMDRLADGLKLENYQKQFELTNIKVESLEARLEAEIEKVKEKHFDKIREAEIERLGYLEAINRELLIDKKFEDISYLKNELAEVKKLIDKSDKEIEKYSN